MQSTLHYTQCGLDNVYLRGLDLHIDDAGEEVLTIPGIGHLHKAIALSVLSQKGNLSPLEFKFLRTEMGMTQAELAETLGKETQTVARWEKGKVAIPRAEEMLIRLLSYETLDLSPTAVTVRETSQIVCHNAVERVHDILAKISDQEITYEPMYAKAA